MTALGGSADRCVADRLELYFSVKLRCFLCRQLFSESASISSKVKPRQSRCTPEEICQKYEVTMEKLIFLLVI